MKSNGADGTGARNGGAAESRMNSQSKQAAHTAALTVAAHQASASAVPPDDMIDTPDDFKKWPFLHHVLGDCRDSLVAIYSNADQEALHAQRVHRRWVVRAAWFATLAILFALLQLTLHHSGGLPAIFEGCSVIGALWAFQRGQQSRQDWLTKRHTAERCRLLKFSSIIHPDLWARGRTGATECLTALGVRTEDLRKLSYKDVQRWLDYDTLSPPPGRLVPRNLEELTELRDYYREKRLQHQVAYFKQQYERNVQRDQFWRRVPQWLFAGSVIIVALHVTIEAVTYLYSKYVTQLPTALPSSVGLGLDAVVACAVLLPAVAAGIRTWRSANETTRNISRFRAKYLALSNIMQRLDSGALKDAAEAEAALRDLWYAEQIMDSEHREWLRLMLEAEWPA